MVISQSIKVCVFCVIGAGVCVCVLVQSTVHWISAKWNNDSSHSDGLCELHTAVQQHKEVATQAGGLLYLIMKSVPAQGSMNAHSVASKSMADN